MQNLQNKHEQAHTNRAATTLQEACALKTLHQQNKGNVGGEGDTGTEKNFVSIQTAFLQNWEQILSGERKLLLLISCRFAVFPPVPPVFVVGAALRFSQLCSSQRGMLSSEI